MFHHHSTKKVSGEKISRRSKKKASLRNSVSQVFFIFLIALIFAESDAEVIDGWEYESNATSIDECQIDECQIDETKCKVNWPDWIGDGRCHSFYNMIECCFDDGDCIEFNQKYPNCKVDNPSWIGNGFCSGRDYNTEACGWDGGDCIVDGYPNCEVYYPELIGDGRCDGGDYNTHPKVPIRGDP